MTRSMQRQPLAVKLQPITGVWTGGDEQRMEYVHATSLAGGLRFWAEALMRSAGQNVCDITSKSRCPREDGPCEACKIFGCTGLGAGHKLKLSHDQLGKPLQKKDGWTVELKPESGRKPPKYYFPSGYRNKMTLTIVPNRLENTPWPPPMLALALLLQVYYGAIGAQDQYGCGIVRFGEGGTIENFKKAAMTAVTTIPEVLTPPAAGDLCFQHFFFFKGVIEESNKDMSRIRNNTRAHIRGSDTITPERRHKFCGVLGREDKSSGTQFNMGVSNIGELYGWGCWNKGDQNSPRDNELNILKSVAEGICRKDTLAWKEFSSGRDTCGSSPDWIQYLTDMINAGASWRHGGAK